MTVVIRHVQSTHQVTGLFGYPLRIESAGTTAPKHEDRTQHPLTHNDTFLVWVRTVQVYDSQPHLRQSTLRIFYDTLARLAGAFLSWLSRKCEGVCL